MGAAGSRPFPPKSTFQGKVALPDHCLCSNPHKCLISFGCYPELRLVRPDDSKLPWESATIRLLVCVEVDPVVNSNWFLDEAFRVLEPGGYMVAVAWNTYSLRAVYRRLKASLCGEQEIYYQTPYLAFRKKLIQRGFVMCREEGYCWGPFGRESNSALIPAVVELEKWLGLRKLPTLSPWIIFIARKK